MTIEQLDANLNEAILTGKAMEAYETYYAEDVEMQENDTPPSLGKAANREREIAFFASVEQFHGAEVLSKARGDGTTFSEWRMDVTFKGGHRAKWTQAVVRRWQNSQIVAERFYYGK
ncbi:MAG TPA: SnoaL-like domain-containing protein [Paludibaculum sp.]|jgi:hypothetical protein